MMKTFSDFDKDDTNPYAASAWYQPIDELSKKTLSSYINKATEPKNNDPEDRVTLPGRSTGVVKASYRTQGMAHTKGKEGMRKYKAEEVDHTDSADINELKTSTVQSYRSKATFDAHAGMAGGTTAHKLYRAMDDTTGVYSYGKEKLQKKHSKRLAGIERANKRLAASDAEAEKRGKAAQAAKPKERQRDQYGYGGEPGRHYTGDSLELNGPMIAEVSLKLLGQYKKKAGEQASAADKEAFAPGTTQQRARALLDKAHKRYKGIIKATGKEFEKSVSEEVKHNELHVSDVGGGKYKVHAVGKKLAHGVKAGEHLTDTELDDATEMGAKIKMIKSAKKTVAEGAWIGKKVQKRASASVSKSPEHGALQTRGSRMKGEGTDESLQLSGMQVEDDQKKAILNIAKLSSTKPKSSDKDTDIIRDYDVDDPEIKQQKHHHKRIKNFRTYFESVDEGISPRQALSKAADFEYKAANTDDPAEEHRMKGKAKALRRAARLAQRLAAQVNVDLQPKQ
jgi:hypothetical protein